jgi:hypothetical protein
LGFKGPETSFIRDGFTLGIPAPQRCGAQI